jgi:sialic acid synthase SpsE
MREVTIGRFTVGGSRPPLVVAEAGINHNGDVGRAVAMIGAARTAGCDAVKFQTFRADGIVTDARLTYTYRSQGREVTEPQLDLFRRCELSAAQFKTLRTACDDAGVLFLSTPQNRSDLDLLRAIGVEAIKVGSDDFTNLPLIGSYAETGLPLILSCGMADLGEIYRTLEVAGAFDGAPVILLYCVSQYPTPPDQVHLNKLVTLRRTFPGLPLGFSDHTEGPLASALATVLGACLLEKHFTLDHDLPGPDHWFSEDPEGLGRWVSGIRTAWVMRGSGLLRPGPAEREMRGLARRSIVALADIEAGAELTVETVGLRRPGTGLAAALLPEVLGRRAVRPLARGTHLGFGDFR